MEVSEAFYELFERILAVIFDMDGLMVESEDAWINSEWDLLTKRGITKEEWQNFREKWGPDLSGRNQIEAAEIYIAEFGLTETSEQIAQERIGLTRAYFQKAALAPGFRPLIETLSQGKRSKIGLASGSPRVLIDIVMTKHRLRHYFHEIVEGNAVKKAKPDPAIYLLAAQRLKVEPNQCLVFEDVPNGVVAAKGAGMFCAFVPNKRLPRELKESPIADFTIETLEDIDLDLIRSKLQELV